MLPMVSVSRQKLLDEGIYPVEIHHVREKKSSALFGLLKMGFLQRILAKEVSIFTRQLSTLLRAGIPLVPSFTCFAGTDQKNPAKKNIGADPGRS